MRVALSGLLLGLAWFAAVNILISVAVLFVARDGRRTGREAGRPLRLRLAPALLSAAFAGLIFLPAHWRLEPAESDETFGFAVLLLAAIGGTICIDVLRRAAVLARAEWHLRRSLRAGREIAPGVIELPEFAGVALAGVLRPLIVIGARTRAALGSHELELAIAHERAHLRSRDNLKRAAMFCAPDVFGWTATARRLESLWRTEAECRADRQAAKGDRRRALHLAAALLKVSRLLPSSSAPLQSAAWSSFHEIPLLERRVRSLLDADPRAPARGGDGMPVTVVALLVATAGAWLLPAAERVHGMTEALLRVLP